MQLKWPHAFPCARGSNAMARLFTGAPAFRVSRPPRRGQGGMPSAEGPQARVAEGR